MSFEEFKDHLCGGGRHLGGPVVSEMNGEKIESLGTGVGANATPALENEKEGM